MDMIEAWAKKAARYCVAMLLTFACVETAIWVFSELHLLSCVLYLLSGMFVLHPLYELTGRIKFLQ